MKWYITFGQKHTHSVGGKTFDKDCVAVIEDTTPERCDRMALSVFKGEFHGHSARVPDMSYYPRGFIEVNRLMK